MVAKSNTLMPCAVIWQLHDACLTWESNRFFSLKKIPQKDLDLYSLVSMSEQSYFGALASSVSGFGRIHTSPVVLHTLPHTHSNTCICSKITQRLRGGHRTTAAASSHKMSVGRHRWHRPCRNLSLIIYTDRLTVLMQRPEKI